MSDFAQRRTMMVDTQVRPNDVTSYPVIDAMLHVPREQFVPDARRDVAYAGENLDLGPGRVLLEPRTLGKMMEILDLQSDDLVLNIGGGYGYSAAVMARIAEAVDDGAGQTVGLGMDQPVERPAVEPLAQVERPAQPLRQEAAVDLRLRVSRQHPRADQRVQG
mgnify:CR=1 FL=1